MSTLATWKQTAQVVTGLSAGDKPHQPFPSEKGFWAAFIFSTIHQKRYSYYTANGWKINN
jgi:hypothetical protein